MPRIDRFSGMALDAARTALPPDQFQTDEGGDRRERGTWRTRRGMVKSNLDRTNAGARVKALHGLEIVEGHAALVLSGTRSDGFADPTTGTGEDAATSLATTFPSTAQRGTIAEYRRHFYVADGWRYMRRWDGRGSALVQAGIAGPSRQTGAWAPTPSTAAGLVDLGTHLVRYRYLDSTTGYVSNPSNAASVVVATTAKALTFAIDTAGAGNIIRSTDAKVDRIVVEMSVASGTAYFRAATALNTASTVVVSLSDVSLAVSFLPWPDDGHDVPPVTKHVVAYRGLLFAFGNVTEEAGTVDVANASASVSGGIGTDFTTDALGTVAAPAVVPRFFQRAGDTVAYQVAAYVSATALTLDAVYAGATGGDVAYRIFARTNVVFVSRPDYPESFPPTNYLPGPEGHLAGEIVAAVGFGTGMIFFARSSCDRVIWDTDPVLGGTRVPIGPRGALGQRVVLAVERAVYSLDREGFWVFDGTMPRAIDAAIHEALEDVNWDQAEEFHGIWYERARVIRWYVCLDSDTYPKDYFEYSPDTGTWGRGSRDHAITAAARVPTSDGPRIVLGDSSGYTWVDDEGRSDGIASPLETHYLVTGSPTTTSIPLAGAALPTTGTGVDGVFAYWLEGDELRLITANTATTLTVSAFTTAPAVGDAIWLGRIESKLKTKAFLSDRGARERQKPRSLALFFQPLASVRYLLARVYENFSATAKGWGRERENPRAQRWPGTVEGFASTVRLVDLSDPEGVAVIGLGSTAVRAIEVELEVVEPDVALELYGIELDGFGGEPPE